MSENAGKTAWKASVCAIVFLHQKLGIAWNHPSRNLVDIFGIEMGRTWGSLLESPGVWNRTHFPHSLSLGALEGGRLTGGLVMAPSPGSHLQRLWKYHSQADAECFSSVCPTPLTPSLSEGERGGCERKSKHNFTSFPAL